MSDTPPKTSAFLLSIQTMENTQQWAREVIRYAFRQELELSAKNKELQALKDVLLQIARTANAVLKHAPKNGNDEFDALGEALEEFDKLGGW